MQYWNKKCEYCGKKIETIGIDRINNKIGYITGNIISCCKICNAMKSSQTQKAFVKQCKKITERGGENGAK